MKQSTTFASVANKFSKVLQGYTMGIRFTAILTILLTMGIGQAWAETWEKVTSTPSDWSGDYLIVYEGGKVAFNGNLTTLDVTSNNQTVTISNNQIELDSKYSFTIEKSNTSYTIKSKSGYYIGNTSNSNALSANKSTAYTNTITLNGTNVDIKSSGGAYLRYNSTSDQKRFRYYKSDTYTNQKAICLYKKANWELRGSFDNWGDGVEMTEVSTGKATATLDLAANTQYKFKFVNGSQWFGNNGTINSDISNWEFKTSDGDVTLNSGLGGTFTFTIDYTNATQPKVAVTYPRKTIYLTPGVWNAAGAKYAIYYFVDGGQNGWSDLMKQEVCNTHVYSATIPQWNGVKMDLVRLKSSVTTGNWNDKWNQTNDIIVNSNDYVTITGWNQDNFTYTTYTPPTYTITFKGNSNTGGSMSNVTGIPCEGSTTLEANGFTRTGYTFNNWKTDVAVTANGSSVAASGTVANQAELTNIKSNITLTAQWKANTNTPYKVKHYKQQLDGTYSTTPDETENCTGTTAASVTPTVKSYSGFKAPSTQTVTIAADGSTVVEYKYTRNSYTLTWNLDGGTITTGGTPAGSVKYGAALKVPTVTKNGYQFDIWNPSVPATMPAADATYTAKWKKLYTVTWMVNGVEQESQTDVAGTNLTKPAEPKAPNSCKDKIFAGWTTINGYSHPTNQPNDLFSCDEATNKTIPVDGITYNAVFATEITEETTTTISKTKIEDFEKQTAGSVYNSTQTYTAANSNAGIAWKMYYGTVSTNAYLSGSKSAQMRWYDSDPENLPYIESLTKVAKLKSISYSVITSDADYKYSVSYSTNGTSWTAVAANQSASTTEQTKTHTINANGVDVFIKIAITSTTNVSDKATFRIDDVVFTYLESTTTTTTTYSDYVTSCIPTYTITWKNDDGTELETDNVEHGVVPTYDGDTPTKEATAQYTYTFNGWTPEIVAATEDATYTATYTATTNTYTITWTDWDGTVLETDNKVPYGTTPTYNDATPNRPEDNTYKYTFAGWDPEVKNVDGDQVYTAKYTQEKHQITVTWMVNGEEYTLGTPSTTVSAGEQVAKLPTEPTPDEENNIYCGQVFAGWTDKPIEGQPITDAPALLFKTSGSSPTIYKEGDKTTIIFYAVFADYQE